MNDKLSVDYVVDKLDQLDALRAQMKLNRDLYDLKRYEAIPEDLREKLALIDAEYALTDVAIDEQTKRLEMEITQYIFSLGVSVSGKSIQAVYNKGRVTWDNKGLEGYSVAHPELLALRKVGDPYVTFKGGKHDKD